MRTGNGKQPLCLAYVDLDPRDNLHARDASNLRDEGRLVVSVHSRAMNTDALLRAFGRNGEVPTFARRTARLLDAFILSQPLHRPLRCEFIQVVWRVFRQACGASIACYISQSVGERSAIRSTRGRNAHVCKLLLEYKRRQRDVRALPGAIASVVVTAKTKAYGDATARERYAAMSAVRAWLGSEALDLEGVSV